DDADPPVRPDAPVGAEVEEELPAAPGSNPTQVAHEGPAYRTGGGLEGGVDLAGGGQITSPSTCIRRQKRNAGSGKTRLARRRRCGVCGVLRVPFPSLLRVRSRLPLPAIAMENPQNPANPAIRSARAIGLPSRASRTRGPGAASSPLDRRRSESRRDA